MFEKECSSFNSSAASNITMELQDKKDVSKVFTYLRDRLNAKEKELLELQRAQPCLLAPDSKQIEGLADAILSLHLSTQDGSFIFPSTSNESSTNSTTVYSTGVDSIKTIPSTTWLSDKIVQKQKDEENQYRLPMVNELFSLPISAYVKSSSSSNTSTITSVTNTDDQPSNRLPMVTQMMSMPISAFKSSSSSSTTTTTETSTNDSTLTSATTDNQPENRLPMVNEMMNMPISAFKTSSTTSTSTNDPVIRPVTTNNEPANRFPIVSQLLSMPISAFRNPATSLSLIDNQPQPVQIEEKKQTTNKIEPKSILITEKIYSKENWLKKSSSSDSESEFVHLDLDQYIEQSTEKMRRLHTEYLQAIEKIKTPPPPPTTTTTTITSSENSVQTLRSMYPQMFDRLNKDLTPKDRTPATPADK